MSWLPSSSRTVWLIGGIFFVFLIVRYYMDSESYQLKCILSDVDGEVYCVRERSKLQLAANLLATVTQKCVELVNYLKQKYPDDPRVQRLVERFDPTVISETLPTSMHTAYSQGKGEKIAFCLDKKKGGNQLADVNTVTFVALHELSHIMTVQVGHPLVFWENFRFLLENAKQIGIIQLVDYKKHPVQYCGMTINDNPYYDLDVDDSKPQPR